MRRHKSTKIVLLASLVGCVFGWSIQAAEVARVGDAVITSDALRQTVARNGYNIFEEASVKQGLDDTVQFELLAAEAQRAGLEQDPMIARQIKELLVQRLLMQQVDGPLAGVHFSDEEMHAYYEFHTNEFRRPALARGSVLTIFITPGKEAEAKAKLTEVLKEWQGFAPTLSREIGQSGSARSPDVLVKKYSDDPSERINGGMSSFFVEGQESRRYPQAVADSMLSLKRRGEVAGPIETPRAFYVIALAERRDAQPTPFEQTKVEIQKRLLRERRQKALAEYCEALKQQFPVTIDEHELKATVQASKSGDGPPSAPGTP